MLAMAIIGMMSIFGNDFGRNPLDDRQCLVVIMFQFRDPKLIFQGFGLLFPDLEFQCVIFFPEGIFLSKGGNLRVLKRPNLLAVTVNPVAPSGFTLPSQVLVNAMKGVFDVEVVDVMSN